MRRNLARVILTTAGIIWGLGFIGNKHILDNGWNESQLLFVRFGTATILIFLIYIKRIIKTDKNTIKKGLFLGVLLYYGFFFQTWGLANTTPSNNALITSGYIIMLPVMIFIFERKMVKLKTIIAGLITLLGLSLVSVDFNDLTIAIGDLLTFIGAVVYGLHIYFLGKESKKVDLFVLMAFQLLTFTVFASINLMFNGGFNSSMFNSTNDFMLLGLAIILGIFGSFVAFLFQSIGQKHTHEAEAAILISTESLFGPIFAIIFYGDPWNIYVFFAIVLVFGGIVLSELDLDIFKRKKGLHDS